MPRAPNTPTLTFREVAPEWATFSDKFFELSVHEEQLLTEMQAELRAMEQTVGASGGTLPPPHVQSGGSVPPPKPPKPIEAKVKELLTGVRIPEPEPELPAPDTESPYSKRMRSLAAEIGAVRDAKAMLQPLLFKAHIEGSRRYCDIRLAEYRAVATRLCDAMLELGDAVLAHDAFADRMISEGASYAYFKPLQPDVVGDPRDRQSMVRTFLTWAAEAGHFDLSRIPYAWHSPKVLAPGRSIADHLQAVPDTIFKPPKRKLPKNPFINVRNGSAPTPDTLAARIHPG